MKTILSLFDYTGNWSKPYQDNGYNVIQIDIKLGVDILTFDYKSIEDCYGILIAVPCDHFAGSGARWWAEKDRDGRTEEGVKLVKRSLEIVNYLQPHFWALENPVGRIHKLVPELGKPKMYFNPCDYAGFADSSEAYTKKTCLWGNFNPSLPLSRIEPVLGSKMHRLPPSENRKELRSTTPTGFARAFYNANP